MNPPLRFASLPATWRSGYAAACKAVYTGSIPVVALAPEAGSRAGCTQRLPVVSESRVIELQLGAFLGEAQRSSSSDHDDDRRGARSATRRPHELRRRTRGGPRTGPLCEARRARLSGRTARALLAARLVDRLA